MALQLDPSLSSRWSARCWVRIKLAAHPVGLPDIARLGGAQVDCKQALALDAGNLDARNALGVIKLMENDASGALVEFQSILALNPENNLALFGRGLAKRGLGDAAGGNTDMTVARRAAPAVSNDFWDAGLVPNP